MKVFFFFFVLVKQCSKFFILNKNCEKIYYERNSKEKKVSLRAPVSSNTVGPRSMRLICFRNVLVDGNTRRQNQFFRFKSIEIGLIRSEVLKSLPTLVNEL